MNRPKTQHLSIQSVDFIQLTLGLVFVLVGLLVLLGFGRKVTLACDRNLPAAQTCTLETRGMVGSRQQPIALMDLQGAYLDISHGDSDSDSTYRVVLTTRSGEIPFTSYYSSGRAGKEKAVGDINRFLLYESQRTLSASVDDRIWLSIFSAVFTGAGVLMMLLTAVTTLELDRELDLLLVSRRRFFSHHTSEYPLSDFKGAEVESDGSNYRVALVFKDGTSLPLSLFYSTGKGRKQARADELNRRIKGSQ